MNQLLPWLRGFVPQPILEVQVARPEQTIADLIPMFSDEGLHHLPVVDKLQRVIGMVTQTDLVAALFRRKLDEGAQPA